MGRRGPGSTLAGEGPPRKAFVKINYQNKEALRRAARAQSLRQKGWTVKEIAIELGRSERTICYYFGTDVAQAIKDGRTEEDKKLFDYKPPVIAPGEEPKDIINFCESKTYLNFKLNPMQKLILKAFYSLPLSADEKKELRALAIEGKTTWEEGQKYRELVVVAGMKGGKTILASVIACYEEYRLYLLGEPWTKYGFPKDEKIFIINVATSKDQAEDTIYTQTLSRIKNSPFYALRPWEEAKKTVFFKDNLVQIRCGHSNSASIVGKLAKLVLFDELARFKDKGGKNSAEAVYTSLTRSIEPFGEKGIIVSISSPLWEKDKIMSLFKVSSKIPVMLGFKLATWEMNPKITREDLKWEFLKNPEAAARDFGADPSKRKEAYYRIPSKVYETFERGKKVGMLPPIDAEGRLRKDFKGNPEFNYYLHGDPAARNDAFGLCLGHRLGDKVILDLEHAFEAGGGEIDIEEIKNIILELIKRDFRIEKATFDTWAAVSVWQALKSKGITVENLYVLKEQHDTLKQVIYRDNLEGQFPAKLRDELKELILERGIKVDHPPGGSKDLADAAAAVAFHCMAEEVVEVASSGKDPEPEETGVPVWVRRRSGDLRNNMRMGRRSI